MPLSFLEKKQTNVSKEESTFTNYEMQVANSELTHLLLPNAYFLPNIIRKISDF
jgi:hypothetical protein